MKSLHFNVQKSDTTTMILHKQSSKTKKIGRYEKGESYTNALANIQGNHITMDFRWQIAPIINLP